MIRADQSTAWVRVGARSGCPACDAGQGCGAGVFGKLLNRRSVEIRVENSIGAVAGQTVLLGLSETEFLALVLRLYGLPLLAGLAGAMVCHQITVMNDFGPASRDLLTLVTAGLSGGLALRYMSARNKRRFKDLPVMLLAAKPGTAACRAASPGGDARPGRY